MRIVGDGYVEDYVVSVSASSDREQNINVRLPTWLFTDGPNFRNDFPHRRCRRSIFALPNHENCLLPCFAKKDSFMIWGAILEFTGEKLLVIGDRGSITAKAYMDHVLQPVVLPFLQHQYQQ